MTKLQKKLFSQKQTLCVHQKGNLFAKEVMHISYIVPFLSKGHTLKNKMIHPLLKCSKDTITGVKDKF